MRAEQTSSSHKPKFAYLDLKAQYATIKDEILAAVTRVLESQHFILGPEVEQFESEIARVLGAEFAVSCASGSDALLLAMMALGIGNGDEVITSPFTFGATGGSIARLGAKPVFVDIDPDTYNLDPTRVEAAITRDTKAILPVHLFGLSAEMDAIGEIARRHKLPVIEDAAQAIGATCHGRHVGNFGAFGCFSFFPSKNLGGAGDGGLISTGDANLAQRLRMLRMHGTKKKYNYEIIGTNSRLDAIQAAILRVKLPHLNTWTEGRRHNAELYRSLFVAAGLQDRVKLPVEPRSYRHVYNQFTIAIPERDALRTHLSQAGIPTEIYYPSPLHLNAAYKYLGYRPTDLPNAEVAASSVLSLPIYPELTQAQMEMVVDSIAAFYNRQ